MQKQTSQNSHPTTFTPAKSLEVLEQEWEAEGRYGSREERLKRAERWIPYYTILAEKQLSAPFSPAMDPNGFIAKLQNLGQLKPSDSVLDIGAGTGEYALRFSRVCREVTALEICPASIRVMEKRAEDHRIRNLQIRQKPWETYETDQTYDLVFSSLCPAICTVEDLRRMETLSRRSCALVCVMPGSVDIHRHRMMQEMDLHPAGMATKGSRYCEVLGAMGRKPEIFLNRMDAEVDLTRESFLERFTVYFSIFGVPEETLIPYLEKYFAENAQDGRLREKTHMELALVVWEAEK